MPNGTKGSARIRGGPQFLPNTVLNITRLRSNNSQIQAARIPTINMPKSPKYLTFLCNEFQFGPSYRPSANSRNKVLFATTARNR
jgi:hypothetical protein